MSEPGLGYSDSQNAMFAPIDDIEPKLRKAQTKKSSLAEAVANTAIGYGIAWGASLVFFWLMGIKMSMHDLWWYTWFMTVISIVRGYYVRRLWETEGWKRWFRK